MDEMVTSMSTAVRNRRSKKSTKESEFSEVVEGRASKDDSSSGWTSEHCSNSGSNIRLVTYYHRVNPILTLFHDEKSKHNVDNKQENRKPKRAIDTQTVESTSH